MLPSRGSLLWLRPRVQVGAEGSLMIRVDLTWIASDPYRVNIGPLCRSSWLHCCT